MEISLAGKVALVTGASRGIGKAIATQFAAAGAKVMITSRKEDALREARAEMQGDVEIFAANAGDVEAGKACVAATIERFGALDILVNNAATNPYMGPTLEVDESRYDKTFQVNLRGPLFWCKAAWEAHLKSHPGVIINIASVGGLRQLAGELGPTRVVGIAPGLVKTDFASVLVENFGERLAGQLPTKRLGEPEDIANLALFLASDKAGWITGETYVIDGGAGVRSGAI
jgi:NAD(P)-dependent dehydrogenase (short-subunit alcohol dehydrogenase family)